MRLLEGEKLALIDDVVMRLEEDELDLIEEVELMLEEVIVLGAAFPVIKISTYPPLSLQSVRYEAEIPATEGPKDSIILMDAPGPN